MMKKKYLTGFVALSLLMAGCTGTNMENQQSSDMTAQESGQQQSGDEAEQLQAQEQSVDIFAMDTYMTLTAYGDGATQAIEEAQNEIERLDDLLSTGNENSEISLLNQTGSGTLSVDGAALVEQALQIYTSTEGAFDITIYPLMEAWGFPTQEYAVPTDETIERLLQTVGSDGISLDTESRTVTFSKDGMQIDLGGIAKGYTSNRVAEVFAEYGITCGIISLGGNVQAIGAKYDGTPWRVAVRYPDEDSEYIGVVSVEDKAVITSGGYERYFEEDGVTYHHILDPDTGKPAQSGLTSVTIVSEDGTLADGLSTALFVMGEEKAEEYWRAHQEEFDMILLQEDGTITISSGLWDSFTSDFSYEVVE